MRFFAEQIPPFSFTTMGHGSVNYNTGWATSSCNIFATVGWIAMIFWAGYNVWLPATLLIPDFSPPKSLSLLPAWQITALIISFIPSLTCKSGDSSITVSSVQPNKCQRRKYAKLTRLNMVNNHPALTRKDPVWIRGIITSVKQLTGKENVSLYSMSKQSASIFCLPNWVLTWTMSSVSLFSKHKH